MISSKNVVLQSERVSKFQIFGRHSNDLSKLQQSVINTKYLDTPAFSFLSFFLSSVATTMEEEEEDTDFLSCVVLVQNNLAAGAAMAVDSKIDHRTLP